MKHKQEKKKGSYWVNYDKTVVYYLWEKHSQRYFKGASVCQSGDKFDMELGVKIARQKAVTKMHSWMARCFEERLEMIQKVKELEPEIAKQHNYWRSKAEESFNRLVNTLNELK